MEVKIYPERIGKGAPIGFLYGDIEHMIYPEEAKRIVDALSKAIDELDDVEKGHMPATSRIVDAYGMLGLREEK